MLRASLAAALAAGGICLLSSTRAWCGADLESATAADKAKASDYFTQGMASFQAGDPAGALEQFRQSYDAVKSPNSHLMVAKALIDLGRYAEAHRELTDTIAEAEHAESLDPKYAQTKQAAQEELSRVEGQVVKLKLTLEGVDASASVHVNETEYSAEAAQDPLIVAPGPLTLELYEGGNRVATQTMEGRAGETLNVTLEPSPAPEPSEPEAPVAATTSAEKRPFPHRRETAYVAGGIGIAGAVTFGVFGLLNNAKYSDVKDQCDNGICDDSLRKDADRGHTYQTIANVGLIVGVVGLGTAVALVLTEDDEPSARRAAPRVALGPGQITLKGTF